MATFTTRPLASRANTHAKDHLNMTANLIHDDWEHLDPTPDVSAMFRRFDDRFFGGCLRCVEVEWSKKMYNCAGICYLRSNAMGRSITIRLSEPLLKLRPRKDLVQTLLHEMIHAIAFVKGVREGNGGHGPFFHKKKDEINKIAGTNITVYHTFHDEVNEYKKHIWRCNGICKERQPFFGYVRRAMNRAPGPSDNWWATHQNTCGGRFEKIAEPEKPKKATVLYRKIKEPSKNQPRIRDIFPRNPPNLLPPSNLVPPPNLVPPKGPLRDLAPKQLLPPPLVPPRSNIRGFGDLVNKEPRAGATGALMPPRTASEEILFRGVGHLLAKINEYSGTKEADIHKSIQDQVRDIWAKRNTAAARSQARAPVAESTRAIDAPPTAKRARTQGDASEPTRMNQWQLVDDDIAIRTPYVPLVDLVDSDSDSEAESNLDAEIRLTNELMRTLSTKTAKERQTLIRKELFESEDEDQITMIDNEFDETLGPDFSTATATPKYLESDMAVCPICEGAVSRGYLAEHMEEACSIRMPVAFVMTQKDRAAVEGRASSSSSFSRPGKYSPPPRRDPPFDWDAVVLYSCPNCSLKLAGMDKLNDHLDVCLS